MRISKDRKDIINGIATAVELYGMQREGQTLAEAVVEASEDDDNITLEEATQVLKDWK